MHEFFLGLIQGITEFLPVSSTGHMVIFRHLFNFNIDPVAGETFLHMGTLIAVIFFLLPSLKRFLNMKMILFLAVATIPAAVIGLSIYSRLEDIFLKFEYMPFFYLANAFFLWRADRTAHNTKRMEEMTWKDALLVGTFQAVALFPGISRSGMTIFGGLSSGLEPEEAARFSFALSIPAILGGNLIQLIKNPDFSHWVPWLPGFFISVISGIFALFLLIRLVSKRKLFFFSFYSLLLAVSLFAIILFR